MPIRLPKVTFVIIPAQQIAGLSEQRVLIPGQMLAAGSATAGLLYRDFPNDGSEDGLFGAKAAIAASVRAFKKINKVTAVDVLPIDDAAGNAGTGVVSFATGAATEDSTIYVTFGSKSIARAQVDVLSGEDQDAVAAKVAAAIVALGDYAKLQYTVAALLGDVTATAENLGTISNNWGIEVEGNIPGIVISITAWAGGATDPVLTGILDAIGNTRYQTILWPSSWDLTVVQALLDARFNVANNVLDGIGIQVISDTLANAKAYADQNSQSIVIPISKKISDTFFDGPGTLEFPDVASAQICAIRALRFTNGALLTQYLTTVAPLDQFGGIGLATLPYFNTSLPDLPVADPGHDFSDEDLTELTESGLSMFGPNGVYNNTIFGEFVTTYLTDGSGNPDDSFKYLNAVDASSVIREFFFVNYKVQYAQTRLTAGELVDGRDMANESAIRAFSNQLYDSLSDDAITQKGRDAKKDFDANLIITVDVPSGTATINMAPLQVGQFRLAIGTIQVNFGG